MVKILGLTGHKNSGKTTLVENLVRHYKSKGMRVNTIKHAHHCFEIDHEGRDSYRHRMAGADDVAVISQELWAQIRVLGDKPEPTIKEVIAVMTPCDLTIVEGYKAHNHPKLEVYHTDLDIPLLAQKDETIFGIVSDYAVTSGNIPRFGRNDIAAIAAFVTKRLGL